MENYTNVDLLLSLNPNGWSRVRWIIDYELFDWNISHIFNDPYSDTIQALSNGIKRINDSFFWYSEPYGIKVELIYGSDNEFVTVVVYDIQKEFYEEIKEEDLQIVISFTMKARQLFILFYFQLKKISLLLEDKEYAVNRSKHFPFHEFRNFEKVMMEYLK